MSAALKAKRKPVSASRQSEHQGGKHAHPLQFFFVFHKWRMPV